MREAPELAPGEIHLWRIPLSGEAGTGFEEKVRLLSGDERHRMARYRFDVHRRRFALRRGALRIVLGLYLARTPDSIVFEYSSRGKPAVAGGPEEVRPSFNLSDSEDLAILGVTLDGKLGVDVERLRPLRDMEALARRYFSAAEQAEYGGLDPSERMEAFYSCWTRKEAWLKAKGEGLAVDLRSFDVTLSPGRPAKLLDTRDPAEEPGRWSLHAFEPRPGFVAAAAAVPRAVKLVLLDL